jgi:hypothetical protein
MLQDICSRSISSVVVPFLRLPLATTIAIAIAASPCIAKANSMDQTILPEETLDRIVSDEVMPLDALGYLGGLFEARFYQPHSTTDDPREEIREAASSSSGGNDWCECRYCVGLDDDGRVCRERRREWLFRLRGLESSKQ